MSFIYDHISEVKAEMISIATSSFPDLRGKEHHISVSIRRDSYEDATDRVGRRIYGFDVTWEYQGRGFVQVGPNGPGTRYTRHAYSEAI